ncbi:hypothetical protein AVEN_261468-1 [Araneus ventricosus]|uniref:Uncharacterized protein n=1 Tax=Araneus ventricosus TaxID=182803 RepID=A0A4Y2RRJ4_ARAVE|nr:hypothetical protein AVEN_261468-1 [Araneus ventricosus]
MDPKHQPPEQPAVNNLERKRQRRESSRLSVFIYNPAGGKSSRCHKLIHNYGASGTMKIDSMVVKAKVRILRFESATWSRASILVPPVRLGSLVNVRNPNQIPTQPGVPE